MSKDKIVTILIIVLILFNMFILEPNSLEVKKYKIYNPKLKDIRIVFVSDFHLKKGSYKQLNNIIKNVNAQQPDLVLLGGDFAVSKKMSDMMDMQSISQKLSLLNAPVYTVLGDYDWEAGGVEIAKTLQANRIRVLENNSVRISAKKRYLDIVGLADSTKRKINTSKAIKGTKRPRVLLMHNPDDYFAIMDDYDLILAGHTHGGQVKIPLTPTIFSKSRYKFDSGLISPNKNKMIITKGIGTTGLPVRLNCRPEIVVIDFTDINTKSK